MRLIKKVARVALPMAGLFLMLGSSAWAEQDKPNILVIWGDDIGQSNISAYTTGFDGLPDTQY